MQPSYQPVLHQQAEKELQELTPDERDRMATVIKDVCKSESPTLHEKVKHLSGQENAFRIRAGELRAVGVLDKPLVKILKIGHRNGVYSDIDVNLADRMG